MKKLVLSLAVASVLFVSNSYADLKDGLVAHYEFEGNANDSSGNGNHGIEYGGVGYVDGMIGKAGSFDGINDYIKITQSNTLNNLKKEATISFWTKYYKPTSGSDNVSVHIANGGDHSTNKEYGYFNYSGKEGIGFHLGYWGDNQSVYAPLDATKNINEQEYALISFIVDENTIKTYKNGIFVEKEERKYNDFSKPSNDWFIGSHKGYLYFLNGQIDDLRIYNRALSESEVKGLYNLKDGISTPPQMCIQVITYAKNPQSGTWYQFNNPCDVPENWETSTTKPDGFNSGAGTESPITKSTIDNLSSGWHLLGTSSIISDLSIFESAEIVWSWNNGDWEAYSPLSAKQLLIEDSSSVGGLNQIEAGKGFWIKK